MRRGVHFDVRSPHEEAHVAPLQMRLRAVRAGRREVADVVVQADTRRPEKGAWNVQVFHGLGDKGYTLNPIFLQEGRYPRFRTALNMALRRLGLPAPFLRPPAEPGRRPSRYDHVNAYGPRFRDALDTMLDGAEISTHGHVALNDRADIRPDPAGPLLWLPTWDNRRYLGGPNQSSLSTFGHEVALVSRHVPVRVKYHPLTVATGQDSAARAELAKEPGVQVLDPRSNPYDILDGVRGILTDTSSLGFEAHCIGLPVAIAVPQGVEHRGLHAELADRCAVMHSGRPDLLAWAESPERGGRDAWVRDLLAKPDPARNDDFATELASHVRD